MVSSLEAVAVYQPAVDTGAVLAGSLGRGRSPDLLEQTLDVVVENCRMEFMKPGLRLLAVSALRSLQRYLRG